MTEIKLEKRYPHSRMEDITDAFMRGYQQGKEDEHRWWSNHCANCKDAEQTEPSRCKDCKWYKPIGKGGICSQSVFCKYEPKQTEPQTCEECEHWNDTEDGCADRHGCKDEPQTDCPTSCPFKDICTKDMTDWSWK